MQLIPNNKDAFVYLQIFIASVIVCLWVCLWMKVIGFNINLTDAEARLEECLRAVILVMLSVNELARRINRAGDAMLPPEPEKIP